MTQTVFTTYIFDENFNFVEEQRDEYSIIDATIDAINSVRAKYEWFNYQGEEYTQEAVWVLPHGKGKLWPERYCILTSIAGRWETTTEPIKLWINRLSAALTVAGYFYTTVSTTPSMAAC